MGTAAVTDKEAKRLITEHDYYLKRLVKTIPAPAEGDEHEVLFVGRFKGLERGGIAGDPTGTEQLLTLHVKPDGSSYVTEGC